MNGMLTVGELRVALNSGEWADDALLRIFVPLDVLEAHTQRGKHMFVEVANNLTHGGAIQPCTLIAGVKE